MTRHEVYITPNEVSIDGKVLNHNENGAAMLTELYRAHVGDYPKFFKMDTLSKLGFVASELLLQAEGAERFVPREDRAVVFFKGRHRLSGHHTRPEQLLSQSGGVCLYLAQHRHR